MVGYHQKVLTTSSSKGKPWCSHLFPQLEVRGAKLTQGSPGWLAKFSYQTQVQ
jgi:hypothetical protein